MTVQTEIYFNTTNLDPVEVQKWREIITGQNAKVLEYYANHPHAAFNAWAVSDATGVFITDCRRAINTMMHQGWLERVGEVVGKKGAKNYTYQFVPKKIVCKRVGDPLS
jgi:predicted transcriptional regulator